MAKERTETSIRGVQRAENVCGECRGDGDVPVTYDLGHEGLQTTMYEKCGSCGGTGRLPRS